MIKRSTWIIFGVFVILAAFAFYWQKSPEAFVSPTPSPTAYPAFLSGWEDKEIIAIEITIPGKTPAVLKRNTQKHWDFTDISFGQVAPGKVEELLTTLTSATVIAEVPPPFDLREFGLETPQLSIQMEDVEGRKVFLKIGDPAPTGSGYYTQVDGNSPVILRGITMETIIELTNIENLREDPSSSEETPMPTP